MNSLLHKREMSGFPISIGTGLSLESLFNPVIPIYDDSRIPPPKANLTDYSLYIFNISTLLRNLISSVNYVNLILIPKKEILEILLDEINFLTEFFSSNNLNIKFYINDYSYVKSTYKPEQLRRSTTDKQVFIDNINNYCLSTIKKEDDVSVFTNKVTFGANESVLLFTHVPWDLLSYTKYTKLELLESNTGIIKTRKNWNTKYFKLPKEDMSFLPFMEYLLSIFGDNVMFAPASLQKRLEVYNSMKSKNVHPLMDELSFSFIFNK